MLKRRTLLFLLALSATAGAGWCIAGQWIQTSGAYDGLIGASRNRGSFTPEFILLTICPTFAFFALIAWGMGTRTPRTIDEVQTAALDEGTIENTVSSYEGQHVAAERLRQRLFRNRYRIK